MQATSNPKLLEQQVAFRTKQGDLIVMTVGQMMEQIKEVCDEWPDGVPELQASQASLSAELRSMRRIAGKMWLRPNS